MKLLTIFSAILGTAIAAALPYSSPDNRNLLSPRTPIDDALGPGELLRITYYTDTSCHKSKSQFIITEKGKIYPLDLGPKGIRIFESAPGLDMSKGKLPAFDTRIW